MVKNVEALGKCSQCGVCQLVCKNVELLETKVLDSMDTEEVSNRDYSVKVKRPELCDKCTQKRCLEVCVANHREALPGADADFEAGSIEEVFVGHAIDRRIQKKAASGGFITSFVEYLLEEGEVDGAILAERNPDNPKYGRFRVYTNGEDVARAASSIYSMIPLQNEICSFLRKNKEKKFVFVGRPCQIEAIERAKKVLPNLRDSISLNISVFCAWSISQNGVDYLTRMSGVSRKDKILDMNYRSGVWPGNFSLETSSGSKNFPFHRADHFKGVYYYPTLTSFIPKECTRCDDVLANSADIAVGDAWYLGFEPKSHGFSLVVCRTSKAQDLLKGGRFLKERFVVDKACEERDLQTSQGYTVKIKQSGVLATKKLFPRQQDERLFMFSLGNRIVSSLVRLRLDKSRLRFLFGVYLKLVWPKRAQKIPEKAVEESTY